MKHSRIVEIAARAAHEVNRTYCEALNDHSQLPWDEAPQWQRESCIKGVRFIIENPNSSPSDQHRCWLVEKRTAGWTYGETKDSKAKTHPCLVPYSALPMPQRCKDLIFGAVVKGILGHYK